MDKLAAEKIATEYYQLGQELALQQAGIIKEAKAGKIMAGLGALGLSPAALNEAGLLASQTGMGQANALKALFTGQGGQALQHLKGLGKNISGDMGAMGNAMPSSAEVKNYLASLIG